MNFEKFKSVKSKLEKLPNVKFYFLSKDTVILRNTKNDGLYQIPCVFEENDTLTLVLSQGQLVEEGKKSNAEIVKAYQEELKSLPLGKAF